MKRILLSLISAVGLTAAGVFAQDEAPSPNYVIQPSDLLSMQVFQEPDLDQQFRVPRDGRYNFPLVGMVQLAGLTVERAEARLRELYDADYLVNPQINLLILEYSQRRVNVVGMVNSPGTIVFPPEEQMTLLDAISRAGGVNRMGAPTRVLLTRTGADGQVTTHTVNVQRIIEGVDENWNLEKDDMIFVPERRI